MARMPRWFRLACLFLLAGTAGLARAQPLPPEVAAALADQDAAVAPTAVVEVPAAARAALIAHLRKVVAEVCGRTIVDVAADTTFDTLGIDSLAVLGSA